MKQRSSEKKQIQRQAKGVSLITKEREDAFYIPPARGIPKYCAELDPYCPRAQIRKFNDDKKALARQASMKSNGGAGAAWVTKTLTSKFENPPDRLNPSLRAKAMSSIINGQDVTKRNMDTGNVDTNATPAEVEILQKVVVRENILNELHKLLDNQTDVVSCVNEAVELIKAIRFQTVDIIEDLDAWQFIQPTPRPFLFRGVNYLLKIATDLDFLDSYDDIVERYCFEFRRNPLAYKEGGNIIVSEFDIGDVHKFPATTKKSLKLDKSHTTSSQFSGDAFVDGIEKLRLHNAEKTIQREVERVERERKMYNNTTPTLILGEARMNNSFENGTHILQGSRTAPSSDEGVHLNKIDKQNRLQNPNSGKKMEFVQNKSASGGDTRKWRQKFDSKKVKMERIAVLISEVNELKAMEAHIEDQVEILVEKYQKLSEKRKLSEIRRKDALAIERDVAAQHIAVEISVLTADMQEINNKIKEFQRQSYFLSLERRRKRKVAKQLSDEVEEEKKRAALTQKLSEKIKEGGLLNALMTLNKVSDAQLKKEQEALKEKADRPSGSNPYGVSEEFVFDTFDSFNSQSRLKSSTDGGKTSPNRTSPRIHTTVSSTLSSSSSPSFKSKGDTIERSVTIKHHGNYVDSAIHESHDEHVRDEFLMMNGHFSSNDLLAEPDATKTFPNVILDEDEISARVKEADEEMNDFKPLDGYLLGNNEKVVITDYANVRHNLASSVINGLISETMMNKNASINMLLSHQKEGQHKSYSSAITDTSFESQVSSGRDQFVLKNDELSLKQDRDDNENEEWHREEVFRKYDNLGSAAVGTGFSAAKHRQQHSVSFNETNKYDEILDMDSNQTVS